MDFQLPLALQPLDTVRSPAQALEGIMYLKEGYSDRVVQKIEDLASRVHLLKGRLAKQTVSVKQEHYWELANVRSLFREFKWRVEQLDEDDDLRLQRDQEAVEATWNDLMHAVDVLLAALA